MSNLLTGIAAIFQRLEARMPRLIELASYVSLATRVEPALLRAARLRFLPDSEPGLEADLWFSPLVQSASPLYFVLRPDIADTLRTRLVEQSIRLPQQERPIDQAYEVIKRIHRSAPQIIQIEEEVIYLALAHPQDAQQRIEDLLQRVVVTMRDTSRAIGLANWAARALPRLPALAQQTDAAAVLALGASARLGGRQLIDVVAPDGPGGQWLPEILRGVARIKVGVRLLDGAVEIANPGQAEAHVISAPKTTPVLLELIHADGTSVQVRWSAGATIREPVSPGSVTIRTLLGDTYTLRAATDPVPISEPSLEERLKAFPLSPLYDNLTPLPVARDDLAHAVQMLNELPLDSTSLTSSEQLPSGSLMPLERSPSFSGREQQINWLAATIKHAVQPSAAAVIGKIGVGKTQLVAEFVHRYGRFFSGGVFWLNFSEPRAIMGEIAVCGGRDYLNLDPHFDTLRLEEQVRLVLQAWMSDMPRLIVFDHCNDERLLGEWQPVVGGCRVILTSGHDIWDPALRVRPWRLTLTTRDESIALLRRYREGLSDQLANAIAEELSDHPLALHLAGKYLARYQNDINLGNPEVYLQTLQQQDSSSALTSVQRGIVKSFALSFHRLNPTDPTDAQAIDALAQAAQLGIGSPIPSSLLVPPNEAGLEPLFGLGLLDERADAMVVLHQLLVPYVRAVVPDTPAREEVEQMLLQTVVQQQQQGIPGPLLPLVPHLYHRLGMAEPRSLRQADFESGLGTVYYLVGEYASAQPYYERALAIREQATASDTAPLVAESLNDLAVLFQARGDFAAAQPLYERALALREQTLGPDHPDTAASLNNLALLFDRLGAYQQARPLYERALAISERRSGANQLDIATNLNNLAGIMVQQGDYAGARPLYDHALTIRRAELGEHNPITATTINNLAFLLEQQGDYQAARPLYEQALAVREQVLGLNHTDTAVSLNNLAGVIAQQGDYRTARQLYERVLDIRRSRLGEHNVDTAASLNNLALVVHQQGDYAAARALYEQALAIREQVLGEEHPTTAASLNSLGKLLQDIGEYDQAQTYFERALRIWQRVFGEAHPSIARTLCNLGILAQTRSHYALAQDYFTQALTMQREQLGESHIDTAATLASLGDLFLAQNNIEVAGSYHREALAIRQRQLGPEHPSTAASWNSLGLVAQRQGDLDRAKTYLEQALAITERALGAQHPTTLQIRTNLRNLGAQHTSGASSVYEVLGDYVGGDQVASAATDDVSDTRSGQVFIKRPTGPVSQDFGYFSESSSIGNISAGDVSSSRGDYSERDIDKRQDRRRSDDQDEEV